MFAEIAQLFKTNPFLAGGASAAGAGMLLAQARTLPTRLWWACKYQCTTQLTIFSEDACFSAVEHWLSQQKSTKRTRTLLLSSWWTSSTISNGNRHFNLSPGAGAHMLWDDGRLFFVRRQIEKTDSRDRANGDYSRKQAITISSLGRSQKPIRELVQKITDLQEHSGWIRIHAWSDPAELVDLRRARDLNTIFCPAGFTTQIVEDLRKFLDAHDDYHKRGVPWRRGYLFYGAPGTGKTSLIFTLASIFKKDIYIINVPALRNDNELTRAVNSLSNAFLVFEDIDSVSATETRTTKNAKTHKPDEGVTLSGILNCMDGLASKEGRVLFTTTNTPENLDPAILREGRIDRHFEFLPAGAEEALAMAVTFLGDEKAPAFVEKIKDELPLPQAKLQGMLLAAMG